ncbi:MAG: hypothetical protein ACOYL6_16045 [Bacteriovoracaceae bacterium]
MITFITLGIFSFFTFAGQAATVPLTAIITASECQCIQESWSMGDEEATMSSVLKKKDDLIGKFCSVRAKDKKISCEITESSSIVCPLSCVSVKPSLKLTDLDRLKVAAPVIELARTEFLKKVPQNVFESFSKKFPAWYPLILNISLHPEVESKFKASVNYFEAAIKIAGETKDISILYFYATSKDIFPPKPSWSFWDKKSSAFLYSGEVPYSFGSATYTYWPCLGLDGKNFDQPVLFGQSRGPMDAGACCGPYSLSDLTHGPKLIDLEVSGRFDSHLYEQCSFITDHTTGKLKTQLVREIDGPANLRGGGSDKAELLGICPDHTKVIINDGNVKGDWVLVYCGAVTGWTHKKNLRP